MGIVVEVYRAAEGNDCTNGGVSIRFDCLTVVNVEGPFNPADYRPAVLLFDVPGPLSAGKVLVPAVWDEEKGDYVPLRRPGYVGPMMGGNYAATSDSRWSQAAGHGAVPIHDRFETVAQCEALSQ